MNNLKKITKELKDELNSLTIKDLANNKDNMVKELQNITIIISDYLAMIKIKKNQMVLPD